MSRLTQDKNLDLLAELYVAFGKNADELLGTDAGRDGAEPQRLGRLDGDDSCSSRPLDLVLRGTHSCQATRDGRYFFRITPGSPLENDYIESFLNGKLRDELLDRELFDTLWEVRVLVERWRQTYNRICPHSSLGNHPVVSRGQEVLRQRNVP